jgi:hypothetical protein
LSQLRDEPGLATVDDLEQLVGTLLSLAGTAYSGGTSLHEIVDVVVSGIQDDNIVDLSDPDADTLKSLLNRLAETKAIEVTAKASQLLRANDRTFRSARIVSDLRPICTGEELSVAGAVIVHQLAIRATHNGRGETTYVTLDSVDLSLLHEAVARALAKDRVLRAFAATSNTPVLTPSEE